MVRSEPSRTSSSPRVKPKFGMNGNGMGGIDRDRRQHRENMIEEVILEPSALRLRQLIGAQHVDAGFGQQRFNRHPVFLLVGGQARRRSG